MTISRQYQKRKTPPRGMTPMKKLPGSMPKMPTLDLPPEGAMGSQPSSQRPRRGAASGVSSTESLEDGDDDETGGDKEDERRMAEIIIKLQLAKQKAAETKKVTMHTTQYPVIRILELTCASLYSSTNRYCSASRTKRRSWPKRSSSRKKTPPL
jgi:hypothetical protein